MNMIHPTPNLSFSFVAAMKIDKKLIYVTLEETDYIW